MIPSAHGAQASLMTNSEPITQLLAIEYLGLSILLGALLTLVTIWANQKVSPLLQIIEPSDNGQTATAAKLSPMALLTGAILNASNVLFLCFGMAGIMILVNNNLARAFAIGAAIALVRFKIKLDSYGLGVTLFFGVVVGMACGVGQPETAIAIAFAFCTLQVFIVNLICRAGKKAAIVESSSTNSIELSNIEPLAQAK